MTIKELKKELGLSNKDLAEFFGLKKNSYENSSAKERYENALCKFYGHIKNSADLVKKLTIPVVVKSFTCDAEEKGGNRCETQCLGCDGFQRMNE